MSPEQSGRIVRRYFEEYHGLRRTEILDEVVSEDLRAASEAAREAIARAFPDYEIVIEEQVTEGEDVATVWTARGTHAGEWESPIGPVAATGRSIEWTGTTTLRVREGRISEVLGSNWDHLGILQQMGAVATVAPRPGA